MSTLVVDADPDVVTVISVFTLYDPVDRPLALDLLIRHARHLLGRLDGFLGCALHTGPPATLINYARWRDRDALRAMFTEADIQTHMHRIRELATVDVTLLLAAEVFEP